MNEYERLDPMSMFSPGGGLLANPTMSSNRGFFALARPAPQPLEVPRGAIEFRLTSKAVVSSGEQLDLDLHIINRGSRPVAVMPFEPFDMAHPKFDYYTLYLRPEREHRAYLMTTVKSVSCDSSSEPGPGDYVGIDRGVAKTINLRESEADGGGVKLFAPGRYVLWSVYRFCGPGQQREGAPAPLQGEFASNSVTIEVR